MTLGDVEVGPLDRSLAEAAYAVVAEVVGAGEGPVQVRASRTPGMLSVYVEAAGVPGPVLVDLGDRVGAVEGTLVTDDRRAGRVALLAEIPCAS
jgi:hypothetical protein